MAFDQSGLRWLGISDLIAEPEGPTFISYKVARRRLDRLRFVTQDPYRTSVASGSFSKRANYVIRSHGAVGTGWRREWKRSGRTGAQGWEKLEAAN
jgi:hypothetical protein